MSITCVFVDLERLKELILRDTNSRTIDLIYSE